ncbi:MAG: hypothetical protein AUK28_10950 [Desulfobacterales bacterium CG2_30_60_27]|nr:MAG: hypothetical protein AUK28_10950 [Desulfobacterales bacterium CG2_30_60_27]
MGHHANNPYSADDRASNAIDRKRERERHAMINTAFKNADELATRLVQRLLDNHIIETTSESAIRELFADHLKRLGDIEDFDLQFKIAPLRSLAPDANFMSLYFTQFIIEDLVENKNIQDVFGDDLEIYKTVNSVLGALRQPA